MSKAVEHLKRVRRPRSEEVKQKISRKVSEYWAKAKAELEQEQEQSTKSEVK